MDNIKLPATRAEYIRALQDVAEIGAQKALEKAGLLKPYLKLREAKRMYGPAIVERWVREGLVDKIKDGDNSANVRINRAQIEAVAKSSNRSTYMTLEEMQEDNKRQK